jgi:hypothetical protein
MKLTPGERRILITAAVMDDAGALADDPHQRVELTMGDLLERVARLDRAETEQAIERGREVLEWSR